MGVTKGNAFRSGYIIWYNTYIFLFLPLKDLLRFDSDWNDKCNKRRRACSRRFFRKQRNLLMEFPLDSTSIEGSELPQVRKPASVMHIFVSCLSNACHLSL